MRFCDFEAQLHHSDFVLRRRAPFFRLLLESVKYIDRCCELDRVDRSIGVAVEVIDDFENAPADEALQGFGIAVFRAILGIVESEADEPPNRIGELAQVVL